MKIEGLGVPFGVLERIKELFSDGYRELPEHWKRRVYGNLLVLIVPEKNLSEVEQVRLKDIYSQKGQLFRIHPLVSDEIDHAVEVVEIMVGYLNIFIDKDVDVQIAFDRVYKGFSKLGLDSNVRDEFISHLAVWLLGTDAEDQELFSEKELFMYENIDRLLRGIRIPDEAHGLPVQ